MKKKLYTNNLRLISATIYPSHIYVFKGFTYETAYHDLTNISEDTLKIITADMFDNPGYTAIIPDGSVIILLRTDKCTDVSIVSHEAFHATEFIMERVGIEHCRETSEAFAYLLGYIVEEIMK